MVSDEFSALARCSNVVCRAGVDASIYVYTPASQSCVPLYIFVCCSLFILAPSFIGFFNSIQNLCNCQPNLCKDFEFN